MGETGFAPCWVRADLSLRRHPMTTAFRSDIASARAETALAREFLTVERTGLRWADIDGDRILIAVDVHNRGERRSQPAEMSIAAAPFGAFVAWQPLSRILVPAIEPGDNARVSLAARRTPVAPVPIERATAEALIERERATTRGLAVLNLTSRMPSLPVDIFAFMRCGSVHWVGNLDVFVRGAHVERHRAQELRIQPGRRNVTYFAVGSRPDAYRFEIEAPRNWAAAMQLVPLRAVLADRSSAQPIHPGQWFELERQTYVVLTLDPHDDDTPAAVGVRVHERSSAREALVEFEFDPAAKGPGCLTE
jgi:hypothetical protein